MKHLVLDITKFKMIVLSLLLSLFFFLLSLIHFNWGLGNKWGFKYSIPVTQTGKTVLNPKPIDCFIIGLIFLLFCLYYIIKSKLLIVTIPRYLNQYLGWIISAILGIRALGDFKYVGVFKSVKHTTFGKLDRTIYTPLCFSMACLALCNEILQIL